MGETVGLRDPARDPVVEPLRDWLKEPVGDPLKELCGDPVRLGVVDALNELVKDPLGDPTGVAVFCADAVPPLAVRPGLAVPGLVGLAEGLAVPSRLTVAPAL
jgi:hypothetical protein